MGWNQKLNSEIWTVARREIALKLSSKAIAFSSIILILLSAASPWISHFVNSKPQVIEIGILPESPLSITELRAASADPRFEETGSLRFHTLQNFSTGKELLKANKYAVVVGREGNRSTFYINSLTSPETIAKLRLIAQQIYLQHFLVRSEVSIKVLSGYLSEHESQISLITEDDKSMNYSIAIFSLVLLYMILSLSGGFLALSIIEEKSGRIMEVLLSSISARQLLLGKILGVLVFSLAQFSLVVSSWLISSALADSSMIQGISLIQFLFYLAWLIPAILFYAFLYGGLGALISRSEDAGAIQGPMSILLIVSVYGGVFSLTSPENTLVRVGILIPPFNFFLGPARYLATGEIGASMVTGYLVALIFTFISICLAIALFETNVLNNRRFSLKRVLALPKSDRSILIAREIGEYDENK